jgi:hypothetical protein
MSWNEMRVTVAAEAPADARADFIKKVYLHLGGAVLAFVALQVVFDRIGLGKAMFDFAMSSGRFGWLLVVIGFVGISQVADRFASQPRSRGMQYAGLGLYVVGEAFIFLPLIYIAAHFVEGPVLREAAVYTSIIFAGTSAIVFITGKDFAFMRQGLMVAGWGALGLVVCSLIFGFNLGMVFSAFMVLLAAGYILYYTGAILRRYPTDAYVAASLALFSAVALLFWYVLRILLERRR